MIRLPTITIPLPGAGLEVQHPERLTLKHDGFPAAFHRAAMLGAEAVRGMWIKRAQDVGVWNTGAYVRGLQGEGSIRPVSESMTEGAGSGATYEIVIDVVATARHSIFVEEGHAAFSLPAAIDWAASGGSIKRGQAGPYLSIPFRHSAHVAPKDHAAAGVTGAAARSMMPADVYKEARQLTRTIKRNMGPVYSSGGQFMAADRYHWGGRLARGGQRPAVAGGVIEQRGRRLVPKGRGRPLVNPAWKSSKFHGMFRSGSSGHSRYMTVRTVTPKSPGWNIPAKPGLHLGRQVAAFAPRFVGPLVRQALASSLGGG